MFSNKQQASNSELQTPNSRCVKRILIIGPSNIGDAILASDVIAAASARFPDAHVALVIGERAKMLFEGDPRIHSLLDTDSHSSLFGRIKLGWSLWRYHPQIVVDLRHTLYPLLVAPLRAWRYFRQPPRTLVHMRQRHLWKMRAQAPLLADSLDHSIAGFPYTQHDEQHVEQLWKRWQIKSDRLPVVICPGARSHLKRWTALGFAQLADHLIEKCGCEVIFSGETAEGEILDEVLSHMSQRSHNAMGMVTVRQLGLIMQRSKLVITNDSASLHMASVMKVPTLAIFGPTDEAKYGPTAPKSQVVRRRLFCTPCELAQCPYTHECMRLVSEEEVFKVAKELLRQETGDKRQESKEEEGKES